MTIINLVENKIEKAVLLFKYIRDHGQEFMDANPQFCATTNNKLKELYWVEDMKEAYQLYRSIFKRRMPFMTKEEINKFRD